MKQSLLATLSALALALPTVHVVSSTVQDPQDPPKVEFEDMSLEQHMKAFNKTIRPMRRWVKDPKKAEQTLEALQKMQMHMIASKVMTPHSTEGQPEAERADWVKSYRKDMIEFIGVLFAIETAVLEGDHEKANTLFGELRGMKKPAHEKYKVDDHK